MGLRHLSKEMVWAANFCVGALTLVLFCGCGSSRLDRRWELADLEDPDLPVRIMAVKWAGDNELIEAAPYLVNNLQNEDKALRFYSIQALRRITGRDCGYDYKASPRSRAQALECWQDFLTQNEFARHDSPKR